MSYKDNKKWRLKNPKKRNVERKRYYVKSRQGAHNSKMRWSDEDLDQIIMSKLSDSILADEIGRSVQAIQVRRYKFWRWIRRWEPSR